LSAQRRHIRTYVEAWHGSWKIGAIVLALTILLGLFNPRAMLHGYLAAFLLVSGIPFGCAAMWLLYHVAGGRWGSAIANLLAAGAITVPLAAVLFVPVIVGMTWLYPWAAGTEALPEVVHHKAAYLNTWFFVARAGLFFLIWCAGSWMLWRRFRRDSWEKEQESPRSTRFGAIGLIVFVLTMSFAAVDWYASLEPGWYSSIFGLQIIIGQALTALAAIVLLVSWLDARRGTAMIETDRLHDLANLLFVLVVLHAYGAYSQYLIIRNGNLPHEIEWYAHRTHGAWGVVTPILILVHFAVPFAVLLSRQVKRSRVLLVRICVVLLAGRVLESVWTVLPSYDGNALIALLFAIGGIIGMGGVFAALIPRLWLSDPAYAAHPKLGEERST